MSTAALETACGNCGAPGTALSICKHCGKFIGITLALSKPPSEQTPLGREIDLLRGERVRLRRALARIAALDPETHPVAGYEECGEVVCFRQAQDIAAEALK